MQGLSVKVPLGILRMTKGRNMDLRAKSLKVILSETA